VKVLLVTMYFPPAGGGGVQRPLKFAAHLPSLGIETHVLAPDDPKWIHRDDELQPPTLAWVHRARYLGPKGRKPAEELHGTQGLVRIGVQARLAGRRLLVPDENVSWNLTAVSDAIAEEIRARNPRGPVVTIANGSDFDDFAGLEHHSSPMFRITHTGSFFGKRDPRPFLTALEQSGLDDVVARFLGDFRSSDREWAEAQDLGARLELIPYAPRRRSLELQRDSEVLLLLIPEAGARGKGVLSGKVFEYLAADRPIFAAVPPDGAAAELIRQAGVGVVVAPDDVEGMTAALRDLRGR